MIAIIKIRDKTRHELKVFAAEKDLSMLDVADKVLLDFLTIGSESARKKAVKELKQG